MKINRRWTGSGASVYDSVKWVKRSSRIVNPDGSVVFEMNDAEVPEGWSQLATDIMVSKYFRKAGVPQPEPGLDVLEAIEGGRFETDDRGERITGPERSAKQVIHRLAGCWRHWGERHGYFETADDAQAFYDEIAWMLLHQVAAPNSPQWFNTGLAFAYGLTGPAQGHYYVDARTGQTVLADDAYSHPQPHACFIQSVDDDLVNPGGIMDLWVREARLFKYGSGTGTNFSNLRGEGEPLSGGGESSGLMSFLKVGDRAAGSIKSGGTTRRAAKMVCLDVDHPDIENFVNWKVREELKVAAMVEGRRHMPKAVADAADKLGLDLSYDFNGEAYQTISGQNSNNSVRIHNRFFKAVDEDSEWELTARTSGRVVNRVRARDLWDQINFAAWRCADPGVQFDTTINEWHTCPGSGRINASNPCSEYMFLDNTACNLASINLLKLYDPKTREFDLEGYEHGIRLWTVVLEISVLMAAFPSEEIARLSYEYRTLGLGYANLGALLMQAGIPYDSEQGRAIAGAMGAVLTGRSYAASAEMAAEHGPFPGYFKNRDHMLRVIRNHRRAAYGVCRDRDRCADAEVGWYEGLEIPPVPIDAAMLEGEGDGYPQLDNSADLLRAARRAWDDALKLGQAHGFRNAQATVIAPTGTIGLLMDCDTTGVEPDFALVKFKKLAGGGYFKIANQSLRPALDSLGYGKSQIDAIVEHVCGAQRLDVPMPDEDGSTPAASGATFRELLEARGAEPGDLDKLEKALAGAMELGFVLNAFTLGADAMDRLGLAGATDPLQALGLSKVQAMKLNDMICGHGTLEGAPGLNEEHLPVFDCANRCGRDGTRFIPPEGHIRMMAAVQPFISGAISKTINLPNEADVEQIGQAYRLSWELGLKANALYRDGSKLSQVLSTSASGSSAGQSEAEAEGDYEDAEDLDEAREEVAGAVGALARQVASADEGDAEASEAARERVVERVVERPLRRRLPNTRQSLTHKFNVAGHEGYLTVGLYEDGQPGELFITMAKEGSTIGGLMDSLGTAISVALQYGVPVESLVSKFTHQRFEPAGMSDNPEIPFAKSLVDYIFRWMGMEFIDGYREANAPRRGASGGAAKPNKAAKASPLDKGRTGSEPTPTHATGRTDSHGKEPTGAGQGSDAPAGSHSRLGADAAHGGTWAGGHGSGNGNGGAKHASAAPAPVETEANPVAGRLSSTLNSANSQMMGDAPACDVCGSITVRNGTCYKCLNCGNSMGCS